MSDYGLGRIPSVDPRDRLYLMRSVLPTTPLPAYRYYRTGAVLDQGATPTCVGHAWRQWLASAPIMSRNGPDPFTIYHDAQLVDEWPGEGYAGTSVRAGAKALEARGHIEQYLWAFTADDIAEWLLAGRGTVVLGTTWYSGMFVPDRTGTIRPVGRLVGGHAYLCTGYSRSTGRFRILNSWGSSWGQGGRAWIAGEDLERLMRENGEAATATERAVKL